MSKAFLTFNTHLVDIPPANPLIFPLYHPQKAEIAPKC
nr:MAG TPA: hypothetical protein [Caudoviricetes sp.]